MALDKKTQNKLWFYPMLFGVLGSVIGLLLRYGIAVGSSIVPFKNILHSHSHTMLLGLLFNALLTITIIRFVNQLSKSLYRLYISLQICVGILFIMFIVQGYAFVTILFSTIHLWLSYAILILVWKQLKGNSTAIRLVKYGIILHFISSLGPYALGPLKAFGMQDNPWYRQAIFFYLHFQYFGSFFMWMLAALFDNANIKMSKKKTIITVFSLALLYSHSLAYSFDYVFLKILGFIGAISLLYTLVSVSKNLVKNKKINHIHIVLLTILILNCLGSAPYFSSLVSENRFILIAWLHMLFLGMYLPFIFKELSIKVHNSVVIIYITTFLITELLLVFPGIIFKIIAIPITICLFTAYLFVVICVCVVFFKKIFVDKDKFTVKFIL